MGAGRDRFVRPPEENVIVGFHAPPPGSPTGVAEYAETLGASLRSLCSVELDARTADVHLYHLGNNRLHESIHARALVTPGVIVLHDAVHHHFMLGTRSHNEYMSEWIYNYGEWKRDLGEELWSERARSATDPRYFLFPMIRRVVEGSRAVIVHNPGAAAIARAHGAATIYTVPHFYVPPNVLPEAPEIARFRDRIGVAQNATLFGVFGYLREPKRVLTCIAAVRKLHAIRPVTALLLAGDVISSDLARLLQIEAVHPAIRRLNHLSERDLTLAIASVDCGLNLRYPGAGETSGIAIRLMGAGKPVIVTDNPENADLPSTAVLRVSPGVAETAELFDHMRLVTDFPRVARAIGGEGQLHIRQRHALKPVVQNYWELLCAAAS